MRKKGLVTWVRQKGWVLFNDDPPILSTKSEEHRDQNHHCRVTSSACCHGYLLPKTIFFKITIVMHDFYLYPLMRKVVLLHFWSMCWHLADVMCPSWAWLKTRRAFLLTFTAVTVTDLSLNVCKTTGETNGFLGTTLKCAVFTDNCLWL